MSNSYRLDPAYIGGSKGTLFALHYQPVTRNEQTLCVIMVPSFAEEMNRCRYMQTMLAQAITARGMALLAVDPYGTGDSQGEFEEADWQQWIDDTVTASQYANSLGYTRQSMLGIRLGALLATAAAEKLENLQELIFWQPVASGKVALNQFMRIKIAASMGRDEEAGTTAKFEEQLSLGNSIEVAGYDVSPSLYYGIQSAHLDNHSSLTHIPISWYTIAASEERKTPRADLQAMDKWRDNGAALTHYTVIGPAFWQAHERTLAPNLITATTEHLAGSLYHE
ncbi:MAG: hydrolase 2, exosortase A system-associated [Porticoccaceae bacterium]